MDQSESSPHAAGNTGDDQELAAIGDSDAARRRRKGWNLYAADRLEQALTHLREAQEARPEDYEISFLLGLTHKRRGSPEKAEAAFEVTLENLEAIEDESRREMLRRIVKRQLNHTLKGTFYLEKGS